MPESDVDDLHYGHDREEKLQIGYGEIPPDSFTTWRRSHGAVFLHWPRA
jgi:hypothetical protein